MADKTIHFGLNLPLGTEYVDNEILNENFSKLDTEVFRRGKAINGIEVNENGDFILEEVPYARDIVTDQQQASSGEYLFRTTGGTASLSDGDATLVGVHGRMEHVGRADEVLEMTVHNEPRQAQEGEETPGEITATLNRATFIAYVQNPASITVTLTYTDAWSANPSLYGVTVEGTPINGDSITIVYVRADRGVITPSHPTKFRSTGWNLYNHSVGYARVKKYSEQYNFIVGGTYTELKFSETLDGVRSAVTVTSNRFSIPSDGYIWVTGGNNVTTYILMTWSDWTSGPEGSWKAYEETAVDFGSIMENNFPYGLCKVGAVIDEINMRGLTFTRRIDRTAYSETTIAQLEQEGTEYVADRDYIYFVMATPVTGSITLTNTFTANDHGLEIIDSETDTAPFVQTLYGENLVEKLRTDIPNQIAANSTAIANKADYLNLAKTGYTVNSLADVQTALTTEVAKMSGRSTAVVMIAFGKTISQFPGDGTWAFLITKAANTTYFNAYAHYANGKRGTIGGQIVMVGYDDGVWTFTNITPVPTTFNLSPPSGWTIKFEYCVCTGNFVYVSGMLEHETGITAKSLVCENIIPAEYSCSKRIAFAAFDNNKDISLHGILQGRQISFYHSETTSLKNIEFSVSYYI